MHLSSIAPTLRGLLRRPRFTIPAILTLAAGLGAATAVFTLVDTALLRPLPYPEAQRIVGFWGQGSWSEAELDFLREYAKSYEAIGAFESSEAIYQGEETRVLPIGLLSPDAFDVIGVEASLGRLFRAEEEEPGRSRVTLLSDAFWRHEMGADPAILGQEIGLDGVAYEVVGVMPPGFEFPGSEGSSIRAEAWLPITIDRQSRSYSGGHYLKVFGRLLPTASLASANQELETLVPALVEKLDLEPGFDKLAVTPTIEPLRQQITRTARAPLFILLGASGLLLLVACANVANLLLAQAVVREREMAIRGALGASRRSLVRQLLGEAAWIGGAGGALALLLAVWAVDLLRRGLPAATPRLEEMAVDGRIFAFGAIISMLTVVLFGLVPALHSSRSDLRQAMGEGGAGAGVGRRRRRTRFLLVAGEMALAALLTVIATSSAQSFFALASQEAGFEPNGLATLRPELVGAEWSERQRVVDFYDRATDHLATLPGVESAGAIWRLPIAESGAYQHLEIEGRGKVHGEAPFAYWRAIAGAYFDTMEIPLLKGRELTRGDGRESPPVGLINLTMANTLWPEGNAVGKRFRTSADDGAWVTVIGIVGDVRHEGIKTPAHFTIYRPFAQAPHWVSGMALVARSATSPGSGVDLATLHHEILSLGPGIAVHRLATFEDVMSDAIARERLTGSVVSVYGVLAVLLASIGIFGLLSFSVGERRREIGIRMALGAERGSILRRLLVEGMAPAVLGIAAGLVLALGASRFFESLLYGVRVNDPVTFAGITGVLLGVALLACWLPAEKASTLEPFRVLREE